MGKCTISSLLELIFKLQEYEHIFKARASCSSTIPLFTNQYNLLQVQIY